MKLRKRYTKFNEYLPENNVSIMVCSECWYLARIGMRDGVPIEEEYQCWNPKSRFFGMVIEQGFECSLFSDGRLPDPEAEKIITDPELVEMVRRKRDGK